MNLRKLFIGQTIEISVVLFSHSHTRTSNLMCNAEWHTLLDDPFSNVSRKCKTFRCRCSHLVDVKN